MNCEYCGNKFSSKNSLAYHQRNTKYCLEKQGKTTEFYNCDNCDKDFVN